jgi:outer membrane protein N
MWQQPSVHFFSVDIRRTTELKMKQFLFTCCLILVAFPAYSQVPAVLPENQSVAEEKQELAGEESDPTEDTEPTARQAEVALNEDPEAQLRSTMDATPGDMDAWPKIHFYGSLRLHAIQYFDDPNEPSDISIGDGASRIGIRGEWNFAEKWGLFGRVEAGFDALETFTSKGTEEGEKKGLEERLIYGGINSDRLSATWGKNWSAYYKIAGMADRFSIFGGQASGVYNAGTDGGATGTGRADDVVQIRFYTSSLKAIRIKPFNLNLQYQNGRPIPHVNDRNYGEAWGGSVWLESQNEVGIGIAVQSADIANPDDPLIKEAGISGDAVAIATSFRNYGENWYSALVLSRLENIETTNTFKYIDGYGAELYTQWQFKDRWWMVVGGNWLQPDDDDEDAGEYNIKYGVLGLRYTFDSFKRMLYAEYRIDYGKLVDGTDKKNEITVGVRWDFDY